MIVKAFCDKAMLVEKIIVVLTHSYCSMSHDRSLVPSKVNSPHNSIDYFLFQYPVSSFFLKVIQELLTSSSASSRHINPFYLFFNSVF